MLKISYGLLLSLLALGVAVAAIFSLSMGNNAISFTKAVVDFLSNIQSLDNIVVWEIRFPRVALAALVGASLGIAGAAMQGFLRNPLAEPGILGVSSGASLGAVIVLYFGWSALAWYWLPCAAILGALISLLLVYLLAGLNSSVLSLILAGVAINAVAGALISIALNFAPSYFALQEIVFWLMGSLANRNMHHVYISFPFILIGWFFLLSRYRFLNALSLGEATAKSLGFHMQRERLFMLLGLACCIGASVAVSGSIGFVGLVIPHLLRPLVGHKPSHLLVVSGLGGALLLLCADLLVRQLAFAHELKLGVVTALLGGPFFLVLIIKSRSRWI